MLASFSSICDTVESSSRGVEEASTVSGSLLSERL